jgi:hypothetical protein
MGETSMNKIETALAVIVWVASTGGSATLAAEPAAQGGRTTGPAVKVLPELAADPRTTEILGTLGEGCSAALPAVKTVGDINAVAKRYGLDKAGPGARDYCIKMAWMPERKRAIFYGANHGVPHRLNDVWEYDLPGNTWVCLYGPDANKGHGGDWSDVDRGSADTKAGIIRTKRGGPAIIPHSWWNMTYDPGLGAMITPCTWSMSDPELCRLLNAGKHKPPLWSFIPAKGRWEPILDSKFEGAPPRYENARAMEYLPELGGTAWIKSDGMWLYDSKANAWKNLKPNGGDMKAYQANVPDREQVATYLPDRHLIVAHSRHGKKGGTGFRTTHYSVEKNEWKVAIEGQTTDGPPGGHDAGTNFVYDRVGKVCLLTVPDKQELWAYDPEATKWSKLEVKGPAMPKGRGGLLAYYDVEQNALVIPGRWVYRHKAAGKQTRS